jgi:hypothetical protein
MPKEKKATRRRIAPPIVAAVVQPVAKRLTRIEALLLEMRHERDGHLKRLAAIQLELDTLTRGPNGTKRRIPK